MLMFESVKEDQWGESWANAKPTDSLRLKSADVEE